VDLLRRHRDGVAGLPEQRAVARVLDLTVWDFDDQRLRDRLPSFEGQREKYVVWGEGTTDEMCLGLLLVTRP
jgi:hypothetical protein